jgi:hypothetical protein
MQTGSWSYLPSFTLLVIIIVSMQEKLAALIWKWYTTIHSVLTYEMIMFLLPSDKLLATFLVYISTYSSVRCLLIHRSYNDAISSSKCNIDWQDH